MSQAPNLLIVYPDQFRSQAIGCMRQDPVITPNLDRLATGGLVLTAAVSNRPVCSPHRAMLFTGKYPCANGVLGNCNSRNTAFGNELRADEVCLSDVLAAAGYDMGYIGKLHLDSPREPYEHTEGLRGDGLAWDAYTPPGPRRHGFGFWHSYGCCDNHMHPHYWHGDAPLEARTDVAEWSVKHETDVAVDFIRGRSRRQGRPFGLFVAYNPPHTPFEQVPQEHVRQYGSAQWQDLLTRPNLASEETPAGRASRRHARNYFAAVTGVDHHVGRLLAALDEQELSDNTIVIFTSDHGEMLGSHGLMHKVVWHEESMRVPMIVRWPRKLAPRRDDVLVSTPDIMPTLLSMMGFADRCPAGVQGLDLSSTLLTGEGPRPDAALYLNVPAGDPAGGDRGLVTPTHTFVVRRAAGEVQTILHDNRNDPYQLRNIAPEKPAMCRELLGQLHSRLADVGDPWR